MDWVKIVLIAIVLIFALIYFWQKGNSNKTINAQNNAQTTASSTIKKTASNSKSSSSVATNVTSKCNFKVTSPAMYSNVSMPFTVKGTLNTADTKEGCVWNQNASRAGDAEIFYNKGGSGWQSAGTSVPIVTETIPGVASTSMTFSASFNLYTKSLGLTSGTPIKIVFTELNIPPQPNPDTFDFLVYLK